MKEGPKRLRVVCDTNVFLSLFGFPGGKLDTLWEILEKDADNRILECAIEAQADVLITGNFKHIRPLDSFRGITILSPREFLDRYFSGR